MKPRDCQIGTAVIVNDYPTITITNGIFIINGRIRTRIKPEGIICGIRKEVTLEKCRKQYTVEFGKRKAIYAQINIVQWYATIILTDGSSMEVNINELIIKSLR